MAAEETTEETNVSDREMVTIPAALRRRLDVEPGDKLRRQFLAANDDQAFTQTEIHEATGIKRGSVGAALSRLEDRGLVRHRGRYWAIGDDDRLASYAAQTTASSSSTTDDYYGDDE